MKPCRRRRVSFEAVPIGMKSPAHLRNFLHTRDEHHVGSREFLCGIAAFTYPTEDDLERGAY